METVTSFVLLKIQIKTTKNLFIYILLLQMSQGQSINQNNTKESVRNNNQVIILTNTVILVHHTQ
jgi:hypothetical protein